MGRPRHTPSLAGAAAALMTVSVLAAPQSAPPGTPVLQSTGANTGAGSNGQAIEPIEPWMERIIPMGRDTGLLSESLQQPQLQLAFPLGFDSVYQVRGRKDLFVRQSGAVYGVFPKSEYITTKDGVYAVWPAGTSFYIGAPPESVISGGGAASRDSRAVARDRLRDSAGYGPVAARQVAAVQARVSGRVQASATAEPDPLPPPPPAPPTTITQPSIPDRMSDAELAANAVLPRFMRDEAYRRSVLERLVADATGGDTATPR